MSLYDRLWNGNGKRREEAPEAPGAPARFERLVVSRAIQLLELNVVTVLLCIPVVTIPAAFSGMARVLMLYWRDMPVLHMWGEYFAGFRENFFEKLLIWLVLTLAPVSIPLFSLFLGLREAAIAALVCLGVLSFLLKSYWFPLCALVRLTPWQNAVNALILMGKEWKYSLWMLVLVAIPYVVCACFLRYTFQFWCLCIFALGQLIQCAFAGSAIDRNHLLK